MNEERAADRCLEPPVSELATPYCFGDATDAERQRFELHLLECDYCWAEVQRLESAVGALRSDLALAHTMTVREMAGLFGMSSSLDRPFAGHLVQAIAASAMYAGLYAVPVLVELAYRWDQFGALAALLAPLTFVWIFATTLLSLAVGIRDARQTRGLGRALLVLLAATVCLCAVLLPLFPTAAIVSANFSTYPVYLGYIKSVFYAWLVGPLFILWPLHFVAAMQRQLADGRHAMVFGVLTGDARAVPPRGIRYPRPLALAVYWGVLFLVNLAGGSHLFDNLVRGPYTNLFMALVMVRMAVWLGLPLVCLWWYVGCLDGLKREALAMLSFAEPNGIDDQPRQLK